MKPFFSFVLVLCFSTAFSAEFDIYEQLIHFGEKADQESIELLEQTAAVLDLTDTPLLLFRVREQFECCGQVFPYTYDDTEYMVVRVWQTLFDELTQGEKRALFGHELMHIKNGDLDKGSPNWWLSARIYRMYALVLSAVHGTSLTKRSFSPSRAINCMAMALVIEAIINEFRYVYEFRSKRIQEMEAEVGSARILSCAQDAISLNLKIEARLGNREPEKENIIMRSLSTIEQCIVSLYSTHPSRHEFNTGLARLVVEQRSLSS